MKSKDDWCLMSWNRSRIGSPFLLNLLGSLCGMVLCAPALGKPCQDSHRCWTRSGWSGAQQFLPVVPSWASGHFPTEKVLFGLGTYCPEMSLHCSGLFYNDHLTLRILGLQDPWVSFFYIPLLVSAHRIPLLKRQDSPSVPGWFLYRHCPHPCPLCP